MNRLLIASLLCGFAFAAGAQNSAPATGSEAADAQTQADDDRRFDRNCLQSTGSRITERANLRADARKSKDKRECAPVTGRSYTQDDLRSTGETDMADALRRLDPSIN